MASYARPLTIAAMLLTIASFATPAAAQQQDPMRQKGNLACSGDARRLCKDVLGQGDMIVLSCFQEHRTRLSSSCRKFLKDVGQLD